LRYSVSKEVDVKKYHPVTQSFFKFKEVAFPPEENATPPVHYDIIDHIVISKGTKKGICASRGLAKSRLLGNYLPLLVGLMGGEFNGHPSRLIVIISATAENAVDMLSEVKDLYESMDDKFKKVLKKGKVWKADEISFETAKGEKISIIVFGAGGKVRGTRRNGIRPELVIFDDAEFEELVASPTRMKDFKRWVLRAVLPSMAPKSWAIWIGTPLPNSFLGEISDNNSWKFGWFPIQDEHGTPAWIDRFNAQWIAETKAEMQSMGEINSWYQEYELKIISEEEQIFKPSMLRYVDNNEVPSNLDIYIMCDLAISSSASADRTSFVVAGVDVYNNIYVLEIFAKRCPPSEQVGKLLELCNRYWEVNGNRLVTLGMERGGLKYGFMDQWNVKLNQIGYSHKIPRIDELDPYAGSGDKKKNSRIQQLEPLFYQNSIKFIRGIENLGSLEEELLAFPAGKHDDILDAFSYILQLIRWREELPAERVSLDRTPYQGFSW